MSTNNNTQIIPEHIFVQAACTLFKCNPDEIELKMITENQQAFAYYKDYGYMICTKSFLRETLALQLTDINAARYIHLGCWIDATRHTVSIKNIVDVLIDRIKGPEEAHSLLSVLTLASYAKDPDIAFWKLLSEVDYDRDIMCKAFVATAEVYNGAGLIDDLTEVQIINGQTVYNTFEGGIFETVYTEDDEYPEFYIYSADYSFES